MEGQIKKISWIKLVLNDPKDPKKVLKFSFFSKNFCTVFLDLTGFGFGLGLDNSYFKMTQWYSELGIGFGTWLNLDLDLGLSIID